LPVFLCLGDIGFSLKIRLEEKKKDKIEKYRLMQKLEKRSDIKSGSFYVFTIMNTINAQYKKISSSHQISFYKRHKLAFEIYCTSETSAKRVKLLISESHNFHIRN
jgi:hypothetical protein